MHKLIVIPIIIVSILAPVLFFSYLQNSDFMAQCIEGRNPDGTCAEPPILPFMINSVPTCHPSISNLTMGVFHCPLIAAPTKMQILKVDGFTVCKNEFDDESYTLKPGETGTIKYTVYRGNDFNDPPAESEYKEILREPSFLHETETEKFRSRMPFTPEGINATYESDLERLGFNQTATVLVIVSADHNATREPMWLGLPPFTCHGGAYVKFVVDDASPPQHDSSVTCNGDKLCLVDKVTRIVDGDTIYLGNDEIRLSLTNTPERHELGYYEANQFTAKLCPVGSMAIVDQDDKQPYDVYGRILGKITCKDKTLNSELLYAEHASILTRYCHTSEFSNEKWAKEFGC